MSKTAGQPRSISFPRPALLPFTVASMRNTFPWKLFPDRDNDESE